MSRSYSKSIEQRSDDFSSSIQATWLLFDGFYRKFKQQQAEINEQTFEADHQNSRRMLAVAVAESFLNTQLAMTNIDIAMANKIFFQRQLSDAENRYEAGVGAWGDVLNIRVQLNSATTSLIFFERSVEASEYGLAALMGISNAALPAEMRLVVLDEKQDISVETEENKSEELIKKALSARPDIRRLELLGG